MFVCAAFAGVFALLAAFGVIPGEFHAPRWVVALAGFAFIFGGLLLFEGIVRRIAVCAAIYVFAALGNWIAFGSGRPAAYADRFLSEAARRVPGNHPAPLALGLVVIAVDLIAVLITVDVVHSIVMHMRARRRTT